MDPSKNAVEVFNKNALLYEYKYMDVSMYSSTFNVFCSEIKAENAAILDLACGPGNASKYILQRRADFQLIGWDLSENMIDIARKNNPMALFEKRDCRDLSRAVQKFEGIICAFGLPYLTKAEVKKFIYDCHECLLEGGVLYLSTMEGPETLSGLKTGSTGDQIFINYHTEGFLKECLYKMFDILLEERFPIANVEGEIPCDLVLIARKVG